MDLASPAVSGTSVYANGLNLSILFVVDLLFPKLENCSKRIIFLQYSLSVSLLR